MNEENKSYNETLDTIEVLSRAYQRVKAVQGDESVLKAIAQHMKHFVDELQ